MDLARLETFRIAACDLNGQMRGKRLPGAKAGKLAKGMRMPLSALNVDILGQDIEDSPLVFASGDADGVLRPTDRGPVPMPWLEVPSALVPMVMWLDDDTPFAGDPRHALAGVLGRFQARGWQVAAATEMEFMLVDDSGDCPVPASHCRTGRRPLAAAVLSIHELDAQAVFFDDLFAGCAAMDLAVDSAISESATGQFELTLGHRDALRAADDAWLFKALAHGTARRHGMAATFMAKPMQDAAGNGMHVHFSVTDTSGRNIFDNGGAEGSASLSSAVAGSLEAMPDSTLIFAPFGPSYDRFVPGAHAPVSAAWGYENRTAAIRIPGGPGHARRIEHRCAGGDGNPYLVLAVVLGAALCGIEDARKPPDPVTGNAYALTGLPGLAGTWQAAIARAEQSRILPRILPDDLIVNLVRTKRQEVREFSRIDPERHWQVLLETA
ncbi:MAG: glutamine synthetase family protein [Marinibacterium sp.]